MFLIRRRYQDPAGFDHHQSRPYQQHGYNAAARRGHSGARPDQYQGSWQSARQPPQQRHQHYSSNDQQSQWQQGNTRSWDRQNYRDAPHHDPHRDNQHSGSWRNSSGSQAGGASSYHRPVEPQRPRINETTRNDRGFRNHNQDRPSSREGIPTRVWTRSNSAASGDLVQKESTTRQRSGRSGKNSNERQSDYSRDEINASHQDRPRSRGSVPNRVWTPSLTAAVGAGNLYTSFEPSEAPQPGQSTLQASDQEAMPKSQKSKTRSKTRNKKKKSKASAPNEQPDSISGVLDD